MHIRKIANNSIATVINELYELDVTITCRITNESDIIEVEKLLKLRDTFSQLCIEASEVEKQLAR